MAYKDEYEVARLTPTRVRGRDRERSSAPTPSLPLHPPLLRALGMEHKIGLGRGRPGDEALAGQRLRGTRLDPFGLAGCAGWSGS